MTLNHGPRGDRLLTLAAVVATLMAASASAVFYFSSGSPEGAGSVEPPAEVGDWGQYTRMGIRLGPQDAPVTVVVFLDFGCAYSREAAQDVREVRRLHPDKVTLVFRHFPLTDPSLHAAMAAQCASEAGAFEAMAGRLFAQPDSFGVKAWTLFANEAGVRDTITFKTCLDDTATLDRVRQDATAGRTLGVTGTPYLLINDRLFQGSPGLSHLNQYVDALLIQRETDRARGGM
ncbi:MAG TPA: thioredoxin domain-containing protein [Longimicrobiales bacterium]|nr:thioredoxin domain-containing protein [Longimicrobiales bacterium]